MAIVVSATDVGLRPGCARRLPVGLWEYGSDVFTGIVREIGEVVSFDVGRLVVRTSVAAGVGDSVSVSGVCLTVVDGDEGHLEFDVVRETLERAKPFAGNVNLEPALRAGDPLGGHYVQGHVDGVGVVRAMERDGEGRRLLVEAPEDLTRYLVAKGSVAVDGVSLTVAALEEETFAVALVPHTLEVTTLAELVAGDAVNLEVDVLAKYVEGLLRAEEPGTGRATIRG